MITSVWAPILKECVLKSFVSVSRLLISMSIFSWGKLLSGLTWRSPCTHNNLGARSGQIAVHVWTSVRRLRIVGPRYGWNLSLKSKWTDDFGENSSCFCLGRTKSAILCYTTVVGFGFPSLFYLPHPPSISFFWPTLVLQTPKMNFWVHICPSRTV